MTEIVNLNRARKARRREEDATRADANRIKFGRTKEERKREADAESRRQRELSGKRLDEES
jgi:hypothetical protein